MRLLDRYLLRELLIPLGYCLGGFLIFWIAFEAFSEMDEFQRHQLRAGDILQYLLLTTPELLGRVVPLGLLLALLYALTNHARHNELTAMRVAGLSLWRLALPYLAVGAACGGGLFALNELLLPDAPARADAVMKKYQERTGEQEWHRNLTFFHQAGGRTNVIGPFHFHLPTGEMAKARLLWTLGNGERHEINAERGVYSNGCWHFFQTQINRYPPGVLVPFRLMTNHLELAEFRDPPARIYSEIKIAGLSDLRTARRASLSLREILEYRRWHPAKKSDPVLGTKLHARLAAPITCLVVVLIALPFGAGSGRRNVFVGVASSVFLCFAYFILQRLAEAAGLGGRIPPWLAGWLPNLLFGVLGVALTFRVR